MTKYDPNTTSRDNVPGVSGYKKVLHKTHRNLGSMLQATGVLQRGHGHHASANSGKWWNRAYKTVYKPKTISLSELSNTPYKYTQIFKNTSIPSTCSIKTCSPTTFRHEIIRPRSILYVWASHLNQTETERDVIYCCLFVPFNGFLCLLLWCSFSRAYASSNPSSLVLRIWFMSSRSHKNSQLWNTFYNS